MCIRDSYVALDTCSVDREVEKQKSLPESTNADPMKQVSKNENLAVESAPGEVSIGSHVVEQDEESNVGVAATHAGRLLPTGQSRESPSLGITLVPTTLEGDLG